MTTTSPVPTAPAKPRKKVYVPIEIPVYTAGIGDVYVHGHKRGTIEEIRKSPLSHRDQTHVVFGVRFGTEKALAFFRHEVISTFESAAVVDAVDDDA